MILTLIILLRLINKSAFSNMKIWTNFIKKNNVIEKKDKNKISLYKKLSPNMRGDVRYKISPSKLKLKFLYL